MTDSFRSAPPSKYREGSEAYVFALVEFAERYGALHPESFAGAECRYVDERPRCVASFTGDLAVHRAALDPQIHVEGAAQTKATWDRLREEVAAWIGARPGARLDLLYLNERDDRLAVLVEADDFDDVARELTARFGAIVQVERVEWIEQPEPFEEWSTDGRTLTVHWIGGGDERPLRLDVQEDEANVTARLTIETRHGPGEIGGVMFGIAAVGYAMSLSADLARPLGDRTVVDAFANLPRSRHEPFVPDEHDDDWMLDEPDHPDRDLDPVEMEEAWRVARATADAAQPYLREHRAEIAAEWFEEYPWGVWFCVAFGPGARKHRPHLDPSINVRRSEHSRSALEALQRDAADFIAQTPGASWSSSVVRYWDPCEREVLFSVTATDPSALAKRVEARFPEDVTLHFFSAPTHDPTPTPFSDYAADDARSLLTVRRTHDGGPAFLLLHETDEAVHVTVVESRPRADPGARVLLHDHEDDGIDEPLPAPASPWVRAELARPLGDRTVIDATSGEPRPLAATAPDED